MTAFDALRQRLSLPLIAAPMFLVSGPDLVIAASRAGIVGAFPTANARTGAELRAWLTRIHAERDAGIGAIAANLIVHQSNARLQEDMAVLCDQPTELVITSVGTPEHVVSPLHAAGSLVFADIASLRHAHRAIEVGVDGLILLTAGAGGQTGWANPFAFVRAVRSFYSGPIVLAGGVSDGIALRAAITLGADLAYMGTKFLATTESLASQKHKQATVAAELDDVIVTSAFTGLPTSVLKPSIDAAGLDPDASQVGNADISGLLGRAGTTSLWRDLYSAGHSTSGVRDIPTVEKLVQDAFTEYSK
ncbi:2-nitropropane dioxygenase [Mycobacteroides chelonae]|uniref:NAD(P)H-dependent flavin oxidoreductase n=1 Tax=Mycobacteroides chelonae TaxID=1774 RepID=UPI0008A8A757|nr:nitronate monooxygenase [Mycobacteroides chelonae]MBF9352896.1 nitronate monooxygenase [Mycobacteroides chelonae]OHU37526.1 2-nitropropane dioxygenase [Mycobacteroides chelonae]